MRYIIIKIRLEYRIFGEEIHSIKSKLFIEIDNLLKQPLTLILIGKVKLTFDTAIEKANEFQQKNFPKDNCIKTIAILQNIHQFGNIWNITYITESFNTLNMKINAENGNVLEHNLSSVFSFRKE